MNAKKNAVKKLFTSIIGEIKFSQKRVHLLFNILERLKMVFTHDALLVTFLSVCDKCIAATSDENWAILVAN